MTNQVCDSESPLTKHPYYLVFAILKCSAGKEIGLIAVPIIIVFIECLLRIQKYKKNSIIRTMLNYISDNYFLVRYLLYF